MAVTMFTASVPVFIQHLSGLVGVLEKGGKFATDKKIDQAVLLGSRIYPDMFPLSRQVREAVNHSANASARVAGVDVPKLPEAEASFDDLRAKVATGIEFLKGLKPAQLDGTEEKELKVMLGPNERIFKGQAYLLGFAMPNFYFHTTTAYAILRQYGVEIGKRDFMGPR